MAKEIQNYPNFLCVGAQKGGTTSLYSLLKQHPDIYVPEKKEIHFFNKPNEYTKGMDYYLSHFQGKKKEQITGEFTPDYLIYDYVPKRIHDTIGKEVKLIFLLRQPISRTYSQFYFYKTHQVENRNNFEDILKLDEEEYENKEYKTWDKPAYYVGRSLYYNQLKRYEELFGKKNMHIIIFEEFHSEKQEEELRKLHEFLGIKDYSYAEYKNTNQTQLTKGKLASRILKATKRKWFAPVIQFSKTIMPMRFFNMWKKKFFNNLMDLPPKLDQKIKYKLTEKYFMDDIKKLEHLLKRDLSIWYKENNQ